MAAWSSADVVAGLSLSSWTMQRLLRLFHATAFLIMRAMAKVGFFGRLANLWRGFVSLWISDVEKKHPEIAYENAINSMIEKYSQLKHATAAIIRRREDIDARYKAKTAELAQVDGDLQTAVETNQADLGTVLIQKKTALTSEVDSL